MTQREQAVLGVMNEGATTLVQVDPTAMATIAQTTTGRRRSNSRGRMERECAGWRCLNKRAEERPSTFGTKMQTGFADSLLGQSALIARVTILDILCKVTRSQMSQDSSLKCHAAYKNGSSTDMEEIE